MFVSKVELIYFTLLTSIYSQSILPLISCYYEVSDHQTCMLSTESKLLAHLDFATPTMESTLCFNKCCTKINLLLHFNDLHLTCFISECFVCQERFHSYSIPPSPLSVSHVRLHSPSIASEPCLTKSE